MYTPAFTVSFEKQMSQKETIVFIILQVFYATRAVLKIGGYINNSNNSRHLARKYATRLLVILSLHIQRGLME